VGRQDTKTDDKVATDVVISQDPAASSDKAKGTPINLVVSGGKEKVKVPDVRNVDATQASRTLNDIGLRPVKREQPDDKVKENLVIATDPPQGTEVDKGSDVALLVSTGPAQVKVPDVVGLDQSDAEQRVREAGLDPSSIDQETANLQQVGKVISQNPPAGTEADKDSAVTLVIGRAPATTTSTTTTSTTIVTTTTKK
jgi:serine/threonine-protein kinase